MYRFANRVAALVGTAIMAGGCLHAQSITVSPGYINIGLGQSQQYTASTSGLQPETVKWGINAGGGTITQTGLYTAPLTVPPNGALISATSVANPKIVTYVYVNPEAAGPTILAITPNPMPSGNVTVTITGSPSTPFITGATMLCGGAQLTTKLVSPTVVSAGDWLATTPNTLTCTVTNPGFMPSNALTVAVSGPPTPAPVVSPATANVGVGSTQQFSASNVTSWTATAGTVTSTGLYTAPSVMPASSAVTVTATGAGGSSTAKVTLVPKLVVSPATATTVLGSKVQFSATNATTWSATYGTVTSAGLYTAPTSLPASGADTVTATGTGGTGTAGAGGLYGVSA